LKNKVKAHAKKALSQGKSSRTQLRRDVKENSNQDDTDETFFIYCNEKYGLTQEDWIMCQECKLWAYEDCTDMENQLEQFTCDMCRY
jgi:hypothetical protein